MSTQYHLVQSGKTASGGCSAGQGSSEPVAPQIIGNLVVVLYFYVRAVLFSLFTPFIVLQTLLTFLLHGSLQKLKSLMLLRRGGRQQN
jgi:hypothetical protein